ncbi:hypothetical protein BV25DRAFT_1833409 [Artomyces pyxidatus]|uniref:Uncharacterized protein n=1 Tax=Artomyces pyxidatus TaxID=48021 RepID=A0ACB8SF66_9AGAM|nr:hypothetical protein BV25DRAFT_1833409 [Artomyces pyxidatus]
MILQSLRLARRISRGGRRSDGVGGYDAVASEMHPPNRVITRVYPSSARRPKTTKLAIYFDLQRMGKFKQKRGTELRLGSDTQNTSECMRERGGTQLEREDRPLRAPRAVPELHTQHTGAPEWSGRQNKAESRRRAAARYMQERPVGRFVAEQLRGRENIRRTVTAGSTSTAALRTTVRRLPDNPFFRDER